MIPLRGYSQVTNRLHRVETPARSKDGGVGTPPGRLLPCEREASTAEMVGRVARSRPPMAPGLLTLGQYAKWAHNRIRPIDCGTAQLIPASASEPRRTRHARHARDKKARSPLSAVSSPAALGLQSAAPQRTNEGWCVKWAPAPLMALVPVDHPLRANRGCLARLDYTLVTRQVMQPPGVHSHTSRAGNEIAQSGRCAADAGHERRGLPSVFHCICRPDGVRPPSRDPCPPSLPLTVSHQTTVRACGRETDKFVLGALIYRPHARMRGRDAPHSRLTLLGRHPADITEPSSAAADVSALSLPRGF